MNRRKLIDQLRLACYREFIIANHGREALNHLDRTLVVELTNNVLEIPEENEFNSKRMEYRNG